jgi:hypothetical protein
LLLQVFPLLINPSKAVKRCGILSYKSQFFCFHSRRKVKYLCFAGEENVCDSSYFVGDVVSI